MCVLVVNAAHMDAHTHRPFQLCMVHASNLSRMEGEAEGLGVQTQPKLHETLYHIDKQQ